MGAMLSGRSSTRWYEDAIISCSALLSAGKMCIRDRLNIPKNLVRPSQQAFYASIIAGHDYKKLITLLDNMLKISN